MKTREPQLPQSDSIRELAEFWDTHDLTDFEAQLEEAPGPVFVRGDAVTIPLEPDEADALAQLAAAAGKTREQLLHDWIQQQLARHGKAS